MTSSLQLKEEVRKEYDTNDAWRLDKSPYKYIYDHEAEEVSKLIIPDNKIVLDIGSGRGRFTKLLSSNSDYVVCVDFYHSLLKAIRSDFKSNKHIFFVMADAENLPFKDESFDLILAIQVFGHLPSLEKSMIEAKRVLLKGKLLIVSLGNVFCANEVKTRFLLIEKAYKKNFRSILPYFKNDVKFLVK